MTETGWFALGVSVIIAAGSACSAVAQTENGDTNGHKVVDMGEIVVTAGKDSLHSVETLGPSAIEIEGISGTVDGLLDHSAGIDLGRRTFSGSDGQRVSIRGFDESRTLVLLNDRSLHGAGVYGGYYIDWASLSLEDLDSVELIRGMAPVRYGNTLGGIVNIRTQDGGNEYRTQVQAGGGSLGTWNAQANHSGPLGPVNYSLAGGHYETDGYLRNSFADRNTFSANLSVVLPSDFRLRMAARHTENRVGMIVCNMPDAWNHDASEPTSLGAQLGGPYVTFRESRTGPLDWGDGSYWNDRRLNLDIGLFRESENFESALRLYLMDQDRQEYFYAVDDPTHLVLRRDSEPEKNNWGWYADFTSRIGNDSAHTLQYGLDGHYLGYGGMTVEETDADYFWFMPTDSPSKDDPITRLHGIYAQDSWQIAGNIRVQAGLRVDNFRADGPEENAVKIEEHTLAPRLACTCSPWNDGRVTVRAGLSYRFPGNPEYYWWYSGFQPEGRRDLTCEKATQYEIEIGQEPVDGLSIVARGYYYEVDDYIRTVFGYRPSRVVYNIDEVDFTGVEVEAGFQMTPELRFCASFTHQKTDKKGDVLDSSSELADGLPELPENKFGVAVSYEEDGGIKIQATVGYVDTRWATMGDLTSPGGSYLAEMESYFDVDVRMSYPVYRDNEKREVRLELAGENLLGEDIVEEYGYPMPGATVVAGMRATF